MFGEAGGPEFVHARLPRDNAQVLTHVPHNSPGLAPIAPAGGIEGHEQHYRDGNSQQAQYKIELTESDFFPYQNENVNNFIFLLLLK